MAGTEEARFEGDGEGPLYTAASVGSLQLPCKGHSLTPMPVPVILPLVSMLWSYHCEGPDGSGL